MALVAQYRKFKAQLGGYAEVPFDEFRNKIVPLRQKRAAWTSEDAEYITGLVNGGAGHALQQFFGAKHQAASTVLGPATLHPEPMTRAELESHMQPLIKSCLTAGWPSERFLAFAAYLDSAMTPKELVAQDREKRRLQAVEASMFQQARAPAEKDDWDDGDAPDQDRFAEMYRSAGPAFKRVVREHLALAAARAREASQSAGAGGEGI